MADHVEVPATGLIVDITMAKNREYRTMRLDGLNCVITGGSSGIGAATARRFVAEGAQVLITDINMEAADALAAELGPAVTTFRCDVKVEAEVEAAAEAAYNRWDKVDVLVNNAGSELNRAYDETTEDE